MINGKFRFLNLSLGCALLLSGMFASSSMCGPAYGQDSYQQLEQMLDNVAPAPLTQVNQGNSGSFAGSAQFSNSKQFNTPNAKPFMQPGASGFRPPNSPLKRAANFLGGAGANTANTAAATTQAASKASLFQSMFGDGAAAGNGSSSGPGGNGAGKSNMYRAQTQAGVAHNAYVRSCYGDHYSRSQAADQAYYAAGQARYEANCAYSKISSSDPYSSQYASSARAHANAANADYYRARSNADSNWNP